MVYVGSTTTELWHRMSQHRADARKGCRSPLYDLMREYGTGHFRIVRMKKSTSDKLRLDEEMCILSIPPERRLNFKQKSADDGKPKYNYNIICKVYLQTESQNKTANIVGCSRPTVKKALRQNNLEIVYPPHTPKRHKKKSA